jgi:hypothetical protein
MKFEMDKIYTFKMNSGEELVAKVLSYDEKSIIVTDPVSIAPGPSGGLGLVPSLFTAKQHGPVTLNTSSVALIANVDENVEAKYIQATTGLITPEKKVLVG